MTQKELETIYTLHEAAEKLRLKPSALGRMARRHGLCSAHGRDLLFSETDLVSIWEIMRVSAKDGIRPAHVNLSAEKAFESLRARAMARANCPRDRNKRT